MSLIFLSYLIFLGNTQQSVKFQVGLPKNFGDLNEVIADNLEKFIKTFPFLNRLADETDQNIKISYVECLPSCSSASDSDELMIPGLTCAAEGEGKICEKVDPEPKCSQFASSNYSCVFMEACNQLDIRGIFTFNEAENARCPGDQMVCCHADKILGTSLPPCPPQTSEEMASGINIREDLIPGLTCIPVDLPKCPPLTSEEIDTGFTYFNSIIIRNFSLF